MLINSLGSSLFPSDLFSASCPFLLLSLPPSLSHLEEVLHPLRVVAVALSADALHLLDLARLTGRLDVLVVDVWVLAEVHDGTQEVKQA